jgi:alcohol dehydrogenase class IV
MDIIIDVTSKRDSEMRAASLLLSRGNQLIKQNKSVKAIALIGQALARLYRHETRKDIVVALYSCGYAYEKIGLLWAARGAYLAGQV